MGKDAQVDNETIEARINKMYEVLPIFTSHGHGPFMAMIYDGDTLVCCGNNSVINNECSSDHAEMLAIKQAQKIFKTHDLSKHNLTLYSSAEPCMMCAGGIMWSGIKEVYFGVKSEDVELITGFSEGPKGDWINAFKRMGIKVKGGILPKPGKKVLRDYVDSNKPIYKPSRGN